jgi:large subunit ribosomal protein L24
MKPSTARNRMLYMASLHLASKQLSAPLSKELQEKYPQNSARVIEGDTVKVMRGEFKGIEGKVTAVSTEKRGVAIEGIKREKLKGGSVDIYIHSSNVMIIALNLEDKWRQSRLEGQKPKTPPKEQIQEQKEIEKPKEDEKETIKSKQPNETKKEQRLKQKEPKAADKPAKKERKTKTTKSKGSDK